MRSEQRSHIRDDWPVETTEHDAISLTHDTVGEHNIDGCTETFNDLDLENGALELRKVHETLRHSRLGELDEEQKKVGDTLAGVGRCGHERDGTSEVLVLVKQLSVETLLGKGELGVCETLGELALGAARLLVERLAESSIGSGLPVE